MSPERRAWTEIKKRCLNPKVRDYAAYGGRGIQICERWRRSFVFFLADLGPRPGPDYSVGRLNNHGHYEPSNALWQTKQEQANNTSRNRFVEFKGERMTYVQACARVGLNRKTFWSRVNRLGWDVDKALSTPPAPPWCEQDAHACNHKLEPEDDTTIARLFEQGATKRSLAARFGVSSCTIKRAIERDKSRIWSQAAPFPPLTPRFIKTPPTNVDLRSTC